MSIVGPGSGKWSGVMDSIYKNLAPIVASVFPGDNEATRVRNAALVLNELIHDFSKSDQFTDKRGILYWIMRNPANQLLSYVAGRSPDTWSSAEEDYKPPNADLKALLDQVTGDQMKVCRLLYKEQIVAGLIKSMFGDANSDNLNMALVSPSSRTDLLGEPSIFGAGDDPTLPESVARLWRATVYPPGCNPNPDHAAIDLAGAYKAALEAGALPKLSQTLAPPPASSSAAAAVAPSPVIRPYDILKKLIESRRFAAGSACVLVATMDCVPKSIHVAWKSIASSGLDYRIALVFSMKASGYADPGTGHLVRKTKLKTLQFNARECGRPSIGSGDDIVVGFQGGMQVTGARVHKFYTTPYNVQTRMLITNATDTAGKAIDHRVQVKSFCYSPGAPAAVDQNTNQEIDSQTAGRCEDIIEPGTSAANTPFSRTNVMLREAFTFRNPALGFLPDCSNWGFGATEKDFLGFAKKKLGDEQQALSPHVVARAPDTGIDLPAGCTSPWGNGEFGTSSNVWIQVQETQPAPPGSSPTISIGPIGSIQDLPLNSALNLRRLYQESLALYVFFTIDILAFIRAIISIVPAFLSTIVRNAGEYHFEGGMAGGMMEPESDEAGAAPDEDDDYDAELLFAFIPNQYDGKGRPQLPATFHFRSDPSKEEFKSMQVNTTEDLDEIVRYLQEVSMTVVCAPGPGIRDASGYMSPDRQGDDSQSSELLIQTQQRATTDRIGDPMAATLDPRSVSPLFAEDKKQDSDGESEPFGADPRSLFPEDPSLSGPSLSGPSLSGPGESGSGQTGDLIPVPVSDDLDPVSPIPNMGIASTRGSPHMPSLGAAAATQSSAQGSVGQVTTPSESERGPTPGSSPPPKKPRTSTQKGGKTKKKRQVRKKKTSRKRKIRNKRKTTTRKKAYLKRKNTKRNK